MKNYSWKSGPTITIIDFCLKSTGCSTDRIAILPGYIRLTAAARLIRMSSIMSDSLFGSGGSKCGLKEYVFSLDPPDTATVKEI